MRRFGMGWVWGAALILLGLGLLSNALGIDSLHNFIVHWWPALLVFIGLGEIVTGGIFNGISWIIVGVVIGLFTTNSVNYNGDIWSVIWPVVIILIGLRLFLRPIFRMKVSKDYSDVSSSSAVFGGATKKITSKDFRSSSVNAVFGGAKLDLRNATVSKEGAMIDISVIFGGAEIIVPKGTPVKLEATAIFGGQEDKRDASDIKESMPAITIRGEVIFGGIEIKN